MKKIRPDISESDFFVLFWKQGVRIFLVAWAVFLLRIGKVFVPEQEEPGQVALGKPACGKTGRGKFVRWGHGSCIQDVSQEVRLPGNSRCRGQAMGANKNREFGNS